MELKQYQSAVVKVFDDYINILSEFKAKYDKLLEMDPDVASDYDFPKKAWQKLMSATYSSKSNGLGNPLPDIYFKIPTGGGKTLLACHAIDSIQRQYLKRQTGLVLWIVPTTQIYSQTFKSLKDREHPYRQVLDIASGGRTLILEKFDRFSKSDIENNLTILLLMLPSANRVNKETLKVFQDSGGFSDFFPPEDSAIENEALFKKFPNLDCFNGSDGMFGRQIKTSLGNTLRTLKPVIIVDEGHKAYSEGARATIRNFNPSFVLELSATPPENSNKLVDVSGKELSDEEMIKLDIHLINKTTLEWKDVLNESIAKQNLLEEKAKEYEQETGIYIRPINLIQVEATGKDQRDGRKIHAEDVREYLIKNCGIPSYEIAVKTSERDELIEHEDIFARKCPIRYIITKYALQEGWDCSFAYILSILTNPSSSTGVTQLIGRILRQPYARKTKIRELDECYVFCYRQNAVDIVNGIKHNLESEGLGDLAGRVMMDSGEEGGEPDLREREAFFRAQFQKFEGRIYLPKFVLKEDEQWRDIHYETDILSRVDWASIDLTGLNNISLSEVKEREQEILLDYEAHETARVEKEVRLDIDLVFLTRQLIDIIPNPWVAYSIGEKALQVFLDNNERNIVASNFVFIIEEIKKFLAEERDKLAELEFKKLLRDGNLLFALITDTGGFYLPSRIKVKSNVQLVRNDNSQLQKSLYDYVPSEGINNLEKTVALYFDEQEKLLWWYRNISRQNYYLQGWKKNKIFPDFITAKVNEVDPDDFGDILVIESKGLYLKNDDTAYKQNVFSLCNSVGKLAIKKSWEELLNEFSDREFEFQVIFDNEWRNKINQLLR